MTRGTSRDMLEDMLCFKVNFLLNGGLFYVKCSLLSTYSTKIIVLQYGLSNVQCVSAVTSMHIIKTTKMDL